MSKCKSAIVVLIGLVFLISCQRESEIGETAKSSKSDTVGEFRQESQETMQIELVVGKQVFAATLEENPATREWMGRLPVTLSMSDFHDNEKYAQIEKLPTNPQNVNPMQTGDMMLYGEDTLVFFYETFETTYRYTPLGKVENVTGWKEALGSGEVEVEIRIKK